MGDITSRLEDTVKLSFTSTGACYPETCIISASFDDERLNETSKKQMATLQSQLQSKTNVDPDAIKIVKRASA